MSTGWRYWYYPTKTPLVMSAIWAALGCLCVWLYWWLLNE